MDDPVIRKTARQLLSVVKHEPLSQSGFGGPWSLINVNGLWQLLLKPNGKRKP